MREGWTYRKLGDVCDILDSRRQPITKSERIQGSIPYYGATGVLDFVKDYIFDGRFLLVGEDGAKWGKDETTAFIIDGKSWVNNHAHILSVHDEAIDSFLVYYLNGKDLTCFITGAVVPKLTQAALVSIPVPIPPLSEQERIVAELNLLQGIIDKQKAQLKELDTLAQSIFYDMFGDPVENEKGWKVKTLGELSSLIINGTTPKGGEEVYVDEGILFLRSQNVWRNRIDYEDIAHIDIETDAKMKKSSLHHNDILITKTGRINTENSSLGRAALFEGETGSANINGHVYLIRLKEGISHRFVIRILTSNSYRDYIRRVCVGGIDKRQINKEHVELFPIILPPLPLQQSFATKIEAIERQKASINTSIAETQKLFDYTMDKYFG